MTNVEIRYNPFLVNTEILINNKPSKGQWKTYQKTRLQQWLADLFPYLMDECNDDLKVTFRGTQLDFEDIKAAADEYMKQYKNVHIQLDKPMIAPDAEARMNNLKGLFEKLHAECPFEDLRSEDVRKKFEEAMSSKFKVSVIATMSSGKSTLINAMLGSDLMPAKNEACTATIASIEDHDELSEFEAVCKDEDGNAIFNCKPLSAEKMAEYNDDPRVALIDIKGNIPFVTSQDMQLVLEDTPGPNNSRTEEHKKHTYKVIDEESKPMVLYILNATQIGTNDDDYLLTKVANAMKVGGKQSRDRFIFVANKVDAVDPDKESLPDMLQHVREYLVQHGIDNPSVYPVSAEFAKVIRLSEQGQTDLTKAQKRKVREAPEIFNEDEELHLEQYAPLSVASKYKLEKCVQQLQQSDDEDAEINEALIHTGVPGVEFTIREYLDKYALTNKIESAVNTFLSKIEEKQLMGQLMETLTADEGKRKAIQEQIQLFEKQIQSGGTDEMLKKMDSSIEKVKSQINDKGISIFEHFNKMVTGVDAYAEIPLDEASTIIYQLKQLSTQIQSDLQSQLEKMIQDTVAVTANQLIQDYNAQYKELLAGQSINKDIMNSIDVIMTDMPGANDFVQKYQEERKWKEKTGTRYVKNENKHWYKPWTWFQEDGHDEDVYALRHVEYVTGSHINDVYVARISEAIQDNVEEGKFEAKLQAKDFQDWFRNELDNINKIVSQKTKELKNATASSESVQQEIQKNKNKVKWLNNFEEELKHILSI